MKGLARVLCAADLGGPERSAFAQCPRLGARPRRKRKPYVPFWQSQLDCRSFVSVVEWQPAA